MKQKYVAPAVSVEIISVVDSMCASIGECVAFDGVSDTVLGGSGGGYVYMNGNQLTYCFGYGS